MDPSHGRYLAPLNFGEVELEADPAVRTTRRRVFLDKNGLGKGKGHPVSLVKQELDVKEEWIYYKSWQKTFSDEEAASLPGTGVDILFVHGLGDAGGRWAKNIKDSKLLDAGFRVWALDLPTHGRSSGVHVHVMNQEQLPNALEAVVVAVAAEDIEAGREQRKTFLVGHSLGGWTVFAHSVLYPSLPPPSPSSSTAPRRSRIAGIWAMAPYLGVSEDVIPNALVIGVARLIRRVKPDVALVAIVDGKVSDSPDVEAEWSSDPITYTGKMRVSTGLACFGMAPFIQSPEAAAVLSTLPYPVRILHGSADRVCSPSSSVELVQKMGHANGLGKKECVIWDGYEHVMAAYGFDGIDDLHREQRSRVLDDLHDWMTEEAIAAKQ